jgi:acetyl-CoA synthetase
MSQKIHPIPENLAAAAHIKRTDYQRTYAESVEDPDRFWACIGHRIDWIEEFSVVKDASYAEGGDRVTIYLPMIPEMAIAMPLHAASGSSPRR